MSNYAKTTDFAAKDALPSGDSGKVIKGTEFETEFDNIATAIATKANTASPTFTGTVALPSGVTLNGTAITSTAAELNILDGVTSTAAELNILDGVTAFLDEDNMASDSATAIPSQQSVKAYVDSVSSAKAGALTLTTGGNQTITGLGFQPSLVTLEVISNNGNGNSWCSGYSDGTNNYTIHSSFDSTLVTHYSVLLTNYAYDASTQTLSAKMRGTITIQSDGFTFVKANADSIAHARWIAYP